MNKTYVFTVLDTDERDKKIVWAQMASDKDLIIENAMDLIEQWCMDNNVDITENQLESLALAIHYGRSATYLDRYIFDLSEVNG